MLDLNEARTWSVERLKFEIDVLEKEWRDIQHDLDRISEDYYNETPETNPGAFDRDGYRLACAAPGVLSTYPQIIDRKKDEIEQLRNIIRSKL